MSTEKKQEIKEEIELNNKKLKSNKGPYVLGEKLGEGAFAKVRLATQIHIKEKCAVKILEKRLLESSRDIQRLKKEIKILKKLRHKNIIQLYDIMESKRNLYFVMEYCKGGELFDYIVKKKRLKEPEACSFFQQIINGVEYLHNQGIIHRDLKPENLLLDDNNHIKISDFGLSTFYSKNNYLQTACGTPSYAPPEMLEGHEYNGEATDVWSCGIILYAMLCGTLPFSESQEAIIVKKIKTHDYSIPNYLSCEAKDLLNHILIINPKERISINQIKKHAWFNLVKPHLMKGINFEEDIIPVDEKILDMVKSYGFDSEECRTLLLKNKFCSLTTIYYLCLKKYVRENGKSISDLESDLFEEYINNPKNKIKKIEEEEEEIKLANSSNNNKTDREVPSQIRLSNKKLNTNKTNKNNFFNIKRNGAPTLNYIKVSNDRRNLKSTKNIKKEFILSENTNTVMNTTLNQNKIKINKETFIENKNVHNTSNINNNKNIKDNKISTQSQTKKNNSLGKNTGTNKLQTKKININKNDISKTPVIECETKNNSIQKKKIKNINNKDKKNITTEPKPKPVRHETEKKPVSTKFTLNEDNNNSSKQKNNNSSISTNVNIINININNNNNTNNTHNTSITDKEISFIIKQKLKEINEIKNNKSEAIQNKGQNVTQPQSQINQNKIKENKNIDNSFKILREEEEELKALLNPLYLKDLNLSSNNQSNTLTNILNNTNNSNLFSSIFQDSYPNQTKTFIGMPQNYSLKTENNQNSNSSRPKSSLFQYLGNDIEKYMLMQGEKPINVINYIAKKLVASSFCGSFNFQSGYNNNNSIVNNPNNNINQKISFLKNSSESNNSLSKSNGNGENKIENSFENNSISKDTSLFLNDDNNNNNDDKDLNFKNLVSILNKKFKSYISKEKLNKTEISNKNKVIKNTNKISHNNVIVNLDKSNNSINNIKKDDNKNNLFNSFTNNTNTHKNTNPQNNSNNYNSYLLHSYSKNSKNNKIGKINQASLKYKNNIQEKNKKYQNDTKELTTSNLPLNSTKINSYNLNNIKSHYNTFLDISTNYDPGMDSRNSSIERSISIKKNELRNFSCSPSHNNKKGNNVNKNIDKKNTNTNYLNNKVMNLTKGNRNFNIISEDDEYKDNKKMNNSKSKKRKKYPLCQNKVTINLSISGENNNSNHNTISNKKTNSKIIKKVTKKK